MDLLDHYQTEGYVIVPDLMPHAKIDQLVERYERFKRGRRPFFSESIHKWILPELDDRGFMVQSMENFTRLWFSYGLNDAGNAVVLGAEINDVLKTVQPKYDRWIHWLNHFFDRSTGSVDHVDSWYLDTDPPGDLVGAWVALEDIHPDAGPFRFFPRSHRLPELQDLGRLDHDAFIKYCAKMADALPAQHAIIRKGTVVFFHPFLLHGAVDQTDRRYSRKSVTAHYLPYGVPKLERTKWEEAPDGSARPDPIKTVRRIDAHPIEVDYSWSSEAAFNLRGMASFAKALVRPTPITMDMRRRSWADR